MSQQSIEILDNYYARELGCDAEDFYSGRLSFIEHSSVAAIKWAKGTPLCLFSVSKETGGVVSLVPELTCESDGLETIIDSPYADDATSDLIEKTITPYIHKPDWFRGVRYFCDGPTFIDKRHGDVRESTYSDDMSRELKDKWHGKVFAQHVGGLPVSWAAIKPLSEVCWDLRVDTLPEYRGHGYGASVVSAAVDEILSHNKIAAWGTDRYNIASRKTAESVGFVFYAWDLGCIGKVK